MLEEIGGSGRLQHRITQRPGQPVEHRAADEEADHARRQAGEDHDLQVVGQEAVVPGQRDRAGLAAATGSRPRGGQLERDRPALGPRQQLPELHRIDVELRPLQERGGLLMVQRQVVGADLQHPALGPEARQWQGRLAPAGHGQLRSRREVVDELAHRLQAVRVAEQVKVVEHEDHRHRGRREDGPEVREHDVGDRSALGRQALQEPRAMRLDPVGGGGKLP
jgi:hypothetical protein